MTLLHSCLLRPGHDPDPPDVTQAVSLRQSSYPCMLDQFSWKHVISGSIDLSRVIQPLGRARRYVASYVGLLLQICCEQSMPRMQVW